MGKQSKAPPKPPTPEINAYGYLLLAAEAARPYVNALCSSASALHSRVVPTYVTNDELLCLAAGLVVTFFGARYMATIAAVEAFRMVGWSSSKASFEKLHTNYTLAAAASAKDDEVDANKDGVADVKQIPLEELVKRKLPIVLKAIDPAGVSDALGALYAGASAVVATLRVQFAQTLTLGAAIGDTAAEWVREPATAALTASLPDEYTKFAPMLVQYVTRMIGVSLAFLIARYAAAAHSAARGSQLLLRAAAGMLARTSYFTEEQLADKTSRKLAQALLALIGFSWQARSGFGAPFPLNVLLLPLSLVEWLLMTAVGMSR